MEILTNYLINDYNDYFDNMKNFEVHEEQKLKVFIDLDTNEKKTRTYSFDNTDSSIIEHIEETNYLVKEQELKYKIFDDISSVIKNKNNKIELVINIPESGDIVTINKIKLSKSIKEFIFDIFVTINDTIILTQDDLYYKKINFSNISNNFNDSNIIDCSRGKVNIHIILEPNSIKVL